MTARPGRTEAAEYYFKYIDQVPEGDVCGLLESPGEEALGLLAGISDQQSLVRYAADKWSIRAVVNHLTDTEQVFGIRALWFARGFESPLPSSDETVAARRANADARSWNSQVEEFRAVRAAATAFLQTLPARAWDRRRIASDNPFTVRALAYLAVGHVSHHLAILQERYLPQVTSGS